MNIFQKLAEAFTIFAQFASPEEDTFDVWTHNMVILLDVERIPEKERRRLEELGWKFDYNHDLWVLDLYTASK